jgi:hypothetical protein
MPSPSDQERLATIEQVLRDVRDDLRDLRDEQKADHHRLRTVEGSLLLLVDEHKQTRERRDYQLRRLGIKVQWLTLAVALGSFALGVTIALLAH